MTASRIVPAFVNSLAFAILIPITAGAQSATSGTISGVARDSTGAVLPGVTVEASSSALIEKVRTAITDSTGNYKIIDLRPGVYDVMFSLGGFGSQRREGITLTTGFTAVVNADLSVGNIAETVTITGASPLVDVQNVRQQTVLSRDAFDALPTGKTFQSYASLTLGAVMAPSSQDVGGGRGETGGTGSFRFHGGPSTDSRLVMDGMMFVATIAGSGSTRTAYVNQLAVEETTIQTSGASADTETGGVVINVVPREGANMFKGVFSGNGSGPALEANNLSPELVARGLGTQPAVEKLFDVGFSTGGPIKRDRLWFFNAHRWWAARNRIAGGYFNATQGTFVYTPDLSRPAYTEAPHHNDDIRLTWQVAAKHKVAFTLGMQGSCICFFGASATSAPESALHVRSYYDGNQMYQGTWNNPATNRLLFDAGSTIFWRHHHQYARPDEVSPTAIPFTDLNTSFNYGARATGGVVDYHRRGPLNLIMSHRGGVSYVTGTHAFKTGINLMQINTWGTIFAVNDTPYGAVKFNLRGGTGGVTPVPASITQYISPVGAAQTLQSRDGIAVNIAGLYVQDQWTVTSRLTLNLGLRLDQLHGRVNATETAATDFVGPQRFPEVDNAPLWRDINPRAGGAFDLLGNGKTALKASLGRYVFGATQDLTTSNAPSNLLGSSSTRTWADADGDLVPDCNLRIALANGECGGLANVNLGLPGTPTTFYDPNYLKGFGVREYLWQGQMTVQHELRPGMALNAGYYRTWYGNQTVSDNRAVTPADHTEYCVTAPVDAALGAASGKTLCGLYDVSPAKFGQVDNFITHSEAFGGESSVYNGFDLSLSARFSRGGMLQGGVSAGQTVTDSCSFVVDAPARPGFCRTTVPWLGDAQLKFAGQYPLPLWGINVSGTFQNLPGPTYGASQLYTSAQIAPSLGRNLSRGATGTISIPLVESNRLYEPRFTQVDVRLAKDMRFSKFRLQGQFDVYNAFNANPVLSLNGTYGPRWRSPISILGARLLKFGAQLDF